MHQTHHLELTVADAPLVLDRVVSLFRARRCAIRELRFEAADRHRPGRVYVTVDADGRRARLATHHLSTMPGVLAVASIGARAERAEVHRAPVTDAVFVAAEPA